MHKTVALVPAYNEGPRLGAVLEIILSSPLVDETIVIDDGSEDNTSHVAAQFPVKILSWKENRGKGAALQAGLDEADDAETFLFLDADLVNLGHEHLEALLTPLARVEEASMTIGVFRAGHKKSVNLAQNYFSILNGQRALKREFVNILPDLSWSRFGVEILLTKYAKLAGKTVLYPELHGITHVTKEEKLGFGAGFAYRLQMYRECLYSLFNYKKMICRYPGKVPQNILKKI
ncbi:MAG: glycosyltransferase family 2 protein [Dethiobacteria bacterium]|jgi:glycosyltransferase involved in cell wall biosynthesis